MRYFCEHEWVIHLDDLMLRRTSWHYYHRDAAALAELAAGWMAELLGWSAAEKAKQLARYRAATRLPPSTSPSSSTILPR